MSPHVQWTPVLLSNRLYFQAHNRVWRKHEWGPPAASHYGRRRSHYVAAPGAGGPPNEEERVGARREERDHPTRSSSERDLLSGAGVHPEERVGGSCTPQHAPAASPGAGGACRGVINSLLFVDI